MPATPSAAAFGDVTYPIGAEADEPAVAPIGWEDRGIVRSGRQRITLTERHALVAVAEDLPER